VFERQACGSHSKCRTFAGEGGAVAIQTDLKRFERQRIPRGAGEAVQPSKILKHWRMAALRGGGWR